MELPSGLKPLTSVKTPPVIVWDLNYVIKTHINQALEAHRYNLHTTAFVLGISRSTLYRKIKDYGLKRKAVE